MIRPVDARVGDPIGRRAGLWSTAKGAPMTIARTTTLLLAAAAALFASSQPALALFRVINPTTAPAYIPVAGPVPCPGGMCETRLEPPRVISLGALNANNTKILASDLAAQKSAYSIAGFGPSLNLNFTVTNYGARNNGVVGGARLSVAFTAQPGQVLPANLHWVQIVTDNYNITGINGANLNAPKGPGNQENVVDAIGVPSPYYDDAFAKEFPSQKANAVPPNFRDIPRRNEPTAANPVIVWNGLLYLVSDPGTKKMTVYNGVEWGWASFFSANGVFPPIPEPSTWVIMLLGFGLAGAALRGRRARLPA
jgi:PEP-CTERM motif